MKEFDKPLKGILPLDPIPYKKVLCRKVVKANERGSKVSIPKEYEGKYVYILVPDEE
jgi:hypothetical protein